MFKVMTQNATATNFVNISAPDHTFKVSHERNKPKVLGRAVPHVRLNVLSVRPRAYKQPDCVDACAIPGEVTDTVRVIASGPVSDKAIIIDQLEYILAAMKDGLLENIWVGLPPNSATELPTTYVGG